MEGVAADEWRVGVDAMSRMCGRASTDRRLHMRAVAGAGTVRRMENRLEGRTDRCVVTLMRRHRAESRLSEGGVAMSTDRFAVMSGVERLMRGSPPTLPSNRGNHFPPEQPRRLRFSKTVRTQYSEMPAGAMQARPTYHRIEQASHYKSP